MNSEIPNLTSSHEFYDKVLSKVLCDLPFHVTRMSIHLDFSLMSPVVIEMQTLASLNVDENGELKEETERFSLVPIEKTEGEQADEISCRKPNQEGIRTAE